MLEASPGALPAEEEACEAWAAAAATLPSSEANGYVQDITQACYTNLTDFSASADCSCRSYLHGTGESNAQPASFVEDGVDWGNAFVGQVGWDRSWVSMTYDARVTHPNPIPLQYDLANVQYLNFTSINNNEAM